MPFSKKKPKQFLKFKKSKKRYLKTKGDKKKRYKNKTKNKKYYKKRRKIGGAAASEPATEEDLEELAELQRDQMEDEQVQEIVNEAEREHAAQLARGRADLPEEEVEDYMTNAATRLDKAAAHYPPNSTAKGTLENFQEMPPPPPRPTQNSTGKGTLENFEEMPPPRPRPPHKTINFGYLKLEPLDSPEPNSVPLGDFAESKFKDYSHKLLRIEKNRKLRAKSKRENDRRIEHLKLLLGKKKKELREELKKKNHKKIKSLDDEIKHLNNDIKRINLAMGGEFYKSSLP